MSAIRTLSDESTFHDTLHRYLRFIRGLPCGRPVPLADAMRMVQPLGVDCRLVCRARMLRPEKRLLTLVTNDSDPLVTVHDDPWDPSRGRALEHRKQVGPEVWEYELSPQKDVRGADSALRLSTGERMHYLGLCSPLATIAFNVGWGREVVGQEADAALDGTELAWAVTALLAGIERPAPPINSRYERLRAATVLAEHHDLGPNARA